MLIESNNIFVRGYQTEGYKSLVDYYKSMVEKTEEDYGQNSSKTNGIIEELDVLMANAQEYTATGSQEPTSYFSNIENEMNQDVTGNNAATYASLLNSLFRYTTCMNNNDNIYSLLMSFPSSVRNTVIFNNISKQNSAMDKFYQLFNSAETAVKSGDLSQMAQTIGDLQSYIEGNLKPLFDQYNEVLKENGKEPYTPPYNPF